MMLIIILRIYAIMLPSPSIFSSSVIKVESLSKTVALEDETLTLLQNINLDIPKGESVALTGESGAGKSTLLALLAGLDDITSGEVFLFGHPLSRLSQEDRVHLRRNSVGFIFQDFQLLKTLNAMQNISVPLVLNGMMEQEARDCACHWLEQVGLSHRSKHMPKMLSGGEQQRVSIARAFSSNPVIIFADEPTANLDEGSGTKIMDLLFEQKNKQGTTLVCVSHDSRLVDRCSLRYRVVGGHLETCS
jgi:putative ABC transport system ATP-binding protein